MNDIEFEFISHYDGESDYRLAKGSDGTRWCLNFRTRVLRVGYQLATAEQVRIFRDWQMRRYRRDIATMRDNPDRYEREYVDALPPIPDYLAEFTLDLEVAA